MTNPLQVEALQAEGGGFPTMGDQLLLHKTARI